MRRRNNRQLRIRKIADFIQCAVGIISFLALIGLEGSCKLESISTAECVARIAVYALVLIADVAIFRLRYLDEF